MSNKPTECYCGYPLVRDMLQLVCSNSECGLSWGAWDGTSYTSKEAAAELRDIYTVLVELNVSSAKRGYSVSPEHRDLYHEGKERAEHYAQLAEGAESTDEWHNEFMQEFREAMKGL